MSTYIKLLCVELSLSFNTMQTEFPLISRLEPESLQLALEVLVGKGVSFNSLGIYTRSKNYEETVMHLTRADFYKMIIEIFSEQREYKITEAVKVFCYGREDFAIWITPKSIY